MEDDLYLETKTRTPRQIYSSWARSIEGIQVRQMIAQGQLYLCLGCMSPLGADYHLDHIISLKEGGHPTSISNLRALCPHCNLSKGAASLKNTNGDEKGMPPKKTRTKKAKTEKTLPSLLVDAQSEPSDRGFDLTEVDHIESLDQDQPDAALE